MSKYPFKTKCPVCDNNSFISWHHVGCHDDYGEHIDIEGYIYCDDCDKSFHMIDAKYDCGNYEDKNYKTYHKNKYESIRYCRIWMALGALGSMNETPEEFINACIENVENRYKQK